MTFFGWITKPAKPYEFWLPQSGVIGGVLLGSILQIVLFLIYVSGDICKQL